MYAQFIITAILVGLGFLILWKFVGKPIVKRYGSDDRASSLEAKKGELCEKEHEREIVGAEIEVTENLSTVEQGLSDDEDRLRELDESRGKHSAGNPATEQ